MYWRETDDGILVELDVEEYIELHKDIDEKIVNRTEVGEVHVSTVWLGLDHRFGEGPPLIYETMIFADGVPHEFQWRYTHRVEAQAMHGKIVRVLQDAREGDDIVGILSSLETWGG